MKERKLYLRPNAQFEPLFNQWYAWSHLISPATAAMNIANSHMKIMKSYVMAPEIHAAAVKNPAMRGGPFIDYGGKRADEVKALMERTTKQQAHMLELAQSVTELNQLLVGEAKGFSLEPLYQKIPESLKGYVEIVYDLNGHPSARFLEPFLYKSKYYSTASQSVALSLINEDERPFAFSTPRLESKDRLHINVPFKSESLDELFSARRAPQSFQYLKESLAIDDEQDELLSSLLTEKEPAPRPRYDGDRIRIRYFGHACILVETRDVSILTDPVLSYSYDCELRRFTYMDLPDSIDYVLITHGHSDHFLFESLLQLRHKIKNIVVPRNGGGNLEDPSLRLILKNAGFNNVIEADDLEMIEFEGGSITPLPFLGEHADLNIRSKAAHLIRIDDAAILCAADSSNLEPKLYEHIHQITGDVDILFLGMECDGAPLTWIYGQLLTRPLDRRMDQSRRLSGSDFQRAASIVNLLKCKQVYVYAMGQEPWLGYITSIKYTEQSKPIVESNKLIEACRGKAIPAARLFGLAELFL